MSKNLEGLLNKYLNNTINKNEFEELMGLINALDDKSTKAVDQVLRDYWNGLDQGLATLNPKISKDFMELKSPGQLEGDSKGGEGKGETKSMLPRKKQLNPVWYAAAATVMILFGLFGFFKGTWVQETLKRFGQPKEQQITLTLEDGKVRPLNTDKKEVIRNVQGVAIGTQENGALEYARESKETKGEVAYNLLSVPYGKQFTLNLSDGSTIVLNAGSVLRYPERFVANAPRKVFLEKGEAFFEVSKDATRKFTVHTGGVDVEVLGTSFNVSAYPEDQWVNTVLVEGSVRLQQQTIGDFQGDGATVIKPGQMGSFDKNGNALSVAEVDTRLYTAWKDGVLMFRQTPFKTICKKLERHFGITIQNDFETREGELYTATFKDESLSEVLNTFKDYAQFDYIVKDKNTIIIY